MKQHRKPIIVGAVLATIVAVGGGIAIASSGGDEEPLTGTALEEASAAAIAHVGGTVVETERGDGDAAYEVEVAKDDGSVVEVSLDADFDVTGTEPDDAEETGDDDGDGVTSDNGEDDDAAETG